MNKNAAAPDSEWEISIHIDDVPSGGKNMVLRANEQECRAIAQRIACMAVDNLEARLRLDLINGGHVLHVKGHLQADVMQACVVSGAPVESRVDEEFEAWFADYSKALPFKKAQHEARVRLEGDDVPMLDEKDDPEPLTDGRVDLGDLVIQYLSLALNPYPRKEGAAAEGGIDVKAEDETPVKQLRPNPFAALKNWRPKD